MIARRLAALALFVVPFAASPARADLLPSLFWMAGSWSVTQDGIVNEEQKGVLLKWQEDPSTWKVF